MILTPRGGGGVLELGWYLWAPICSCGTLFQLKIQFYPPKSPLRDAFLAHKSNLIRPKGPSGTLFQLKIQFFYAPRIPADPFARSAVSPQRSSRAAQFSRSAVSAIPSKPGRAQGWAKGPKQKAQGQRA